MSNYLFDDFLKFRISFSNIETKFFVVVDFFIIFYKTKVSAIESDLFRVN